jgi:hypothetical protein
VPNRKCSPRPHQQSCKSSNRARSRSGSPIERDAVERLGEALQAEARQQTQQGSGGVGTARPGRQTQAGFAIELFSWLAHEVAGSAGRACAAVIIGTDAKGVLAVAAADGSRGMAGGTLRVDRQAAVLRARIGFARLARTEAVVVEAVGPGGAIVVGWEATRAHPVDRRTHLRQEPVRADGGARNPPIFGGPPRVVVGIVS